MYSYLTGLFEDYLKAWRHYSLSFVVSLFASILAIILIRYNADAPILERLLYVSWFAFPLFIAHWRANQHKYYKTSVLLALGWIVSAWAMYRYLASNNIFANYAWSLSSEYFVMIMSMIGAWMIPLLGTLIIRKDHTESLWQDWRLLISHLAVAIVSWGILRGWLSASLASIGYLFDLVVHYTWYEYIGVVALGVVWVGILLSKIAGILEQDYAHYPKLFRFFWLYVFFPLAIVYAAILLLYGAKIVIAGIWPKGLVAWMVIGYMIWWMLSYLLTHPLRNQSRFVARASRGYLVSSIVFSWLLLWASMLRISEYGWTIPRYMLIVIVIWMHIIGIRGLWKKRLDLQGILIAFLGLLVLSTYMPWNAWFVAQTSQIAKVEQLMQDWSLAPRAAFASQALHVDELSETQQEYLSRVAQSSYYLYTNFGAKAMIRLFPEIDEQQRLNKSPGRNLWAYILREVFNLQWNVEELVRYASSSTPEETNYFFVSRDSSTTDPLELENFKYMIRIANYNLPYQYQDDDLKVDVDRNGQVNITYWDKDISFAIQDLAQEFYSMSQQIPQRTSIKTEWYLIVVDHASWTKQSWQADYVLDGYELILFVQ